MALFRYNKISSLRIGPSMAVLLVLGACVTASPVQQNSSRAESAPVPPAAILKSRAPAPLLDDEQRAAFDRGVAAIEDGNGVVAEELFSKLAGQLPEIAAVHANLGSAYMLLGNAPAAIATYQRAVSLNPNLATAYVRLGVLFRRAERIEEAQAAYKAALNADPNNRLAHLNLGILYDLYLREPARALSHYEQFQVLSEQQDKEVALWIADLKQRL